MTHKIISSLLTWIIRLTAVFIILISITLFMLSSMSGKGESQRKGLEQAFTDGLDMPVTIGTLNYFNAIPQFKIDAASFKAGTKFDKTYIIADQVILGFSLWDIVRNQKTIQEFTILNADIAMPAITNQKFEKTNIRILQPELTKPARLYLNGITGGHKIELSITMQTRVTNLLNNYYLSDKEIIMAKSGACEINGLFEKNNTPPMKWDMPKTPNKNCKPVLDLIK